VTGSLLHWGLVYVVVSDVQGVVAIGSLFWLKLIEGEGPCVAWCMLAMDASHGYHGMCVVMLGIWLTIVFELSALKPHVCSFPTSPL